MHEPGDAADPLANGASALKRRESTIEDIAMAATLSRRVTFADEPPSDHAARLANALAEDVRRSGADATPTVPASKLEGAAANSDSRSSSMLAIPKSVRPQPGPASKKVYMDRFTPLIPNALAFLSLGVVQPAVMDSRAEDEMRREERECEVLAQFTLEAMHAFLCDDSANPFDEYRDVLATRAICQSIPTVMVRFPENTMVQQHGMTIIAKFAAHGFDMSLLGETLCQALVTAMGACPQDQQLHKSFAITVKFLALSSAEFRTLLIESEAHKWLYIILQCGWKDVAAEACAAVANLAVDLVPARALGHIGCTLLVLKMMDNQAESTQVQFHGLRALAGLCRIPENLALFRNANGQRAVKRAKRLLKGQPEAMELLRQFPRSLGGSGGGGAVGGGGGGGGSAGGAGGAGAGEGPCTIA